MNLKEGWSKAKIDTNIMERYCNNQISLDTAIELMEDNNECDITLEEFQELLWKCGFRRKINAYEFKL